MKLYRLLELHNQFKPVDALPLSLGDGFLIQHNSMYARIRKATLQNGFSFTTDVDPAYAALPLSQLDQVLLNKKIPYFDNVSVLKQVENKIPQATLWDEVSDNLKRNFIFHESCHAVSRPEAEKVFAGESSVQKNILKLIFEESFSNTCELLGIVDVEQPAHRLFYEANSYIYIYEDRVHLKDLINEFGYAMSMKFLMFSYLHSNFLFEKLDDKTFDRILKTLKLQSLDSKKNKKLRLISRIAFQLNPRFRMVTSGFFLRLSGFKTQDNAWAEFDFMSLVETDPRYLRLVDELVKKVT